MWRRILAEWRKGSCSKNSIPKNIFPMLLKRLCDGLNEKKQNLVAGFKACGIFPKDQEQVLKRLPPANSQPVQEVLGNAVATMLEEYISPRQTASRKRGLKITPGADIADLKSSRSDARKRNVLLQNPMIPVKMKGKFASSATSWTLHEVEAEMWIGRDVTIVICGITKSASETMVD
ncbi:uncharacterized protein LOC143468348 [Clavelina lepadiformis]|uniref:uncharacterized protein LOC143468348 n=1 Tax=Clavelina lepadiformis TaxID=159417 RepID=UPI00404292D8